MLQGCGYCQPSAVRLPVGGIKASVFVPEKPVSLKVFQFLKRMRLPPRSLEENVVECRNETACEKFHIKEVMGLHEKCVGCARLQDERCVAYEKPEVWWDRRGHCPLATHRKRILSPVEEGKVRVGQQKQRKFKGRK